jgi:mannitol/fructose-specific phosphotransferase system IIA component
MDQVLEDLIGDICFVYLDDVIVFSENEEEHYKNLQILIERLKQANLKVKLLKCQNAEHVKTCNLCQKIKPPSFYN